MRERRSMLEILLLFQDAFLASLLIALGCAVTGVFVVYRRVVFVSAALAQLSSAGVALALFLAGWGVGLGWLGSELFLSSVLTLGGVLFFALEGDRHRIPGDARLGIAYVMAGAVAVLLVAQAAGGDAHALLFRGNILGIRGDETLLLMGVMAGVLLLHLLFHKEFVFVSFDGEMAATLGYRVRLWTVILYLTLGAVIAVSIASAGVLLVFSSLVLPPVTGILLGRSLRGVLFWSAGSGVGAAAAGFLLSIRFDLPTGPSIVATSGVLVALAWWGGGLLGRGTAQG
jgi:ABC-type Mn2+/Zn2+ transport system permease subunit